MIIFNALGFAFIGMGVSVAALIAYLAGVHSEGGWTLTLGCVVLVADLAFRLLHKDGHWLRPNNGGHVFRLPAWMFGLLWVVLGTVYLHRGDTPRAQSSNASSDRSIWLPSRGRMAALPQ